MRMYSWGQNVKRRALTPGNAVLAMALCAGLANASSTAAVAAETKTIGYIEIEGSPSDKPEEMAQLFGGSKQPTLRQLIDAIASVANDDDYAGLVIRLKDAQLKATQVEELGATITLIRSLGKKVHVFSESYDAADLMLASYADEVIAQEGGPISLPGIYMEEMFLADTLAWAGVKPSYVQVGDYKGASEQMSRSSPSPQWNQNIEGLLDGLYAGLRAPILEGRKMTGSQLDKAMETAWMADAQDAKDLGLVDTVLDMPNLTDHLKTSYDANIKWDRNLVEEAKGSLDTSNPFALFAALSKQPDHKPKGPTIAVLHIDGAIVDGESGGGGLFGGSSVGSRTIRNALEEIRKQSLIKGVVIRIDSPGGSATASEIIWQGVSRVAAEKPVWVSVGSMAASGGYYIAVAGDQIYVNPSSIVGSIGVVGGKLAMEGLYDKLNVNVVSRGRGPRSELFSSVKPWNEAESTLVRDKMTQTYEQFTKRVTAGREGIELDKTAEGRLFVGAQAINLKMADKIGGLDIAVDDLAASLSLDDYAVMDYPGPRPFSKVLEEAFKGFVMAPTASAPTSAAAPLAAGIRELVGEHVWSQIAPAARGLLELRDQRVLLMSPRVLIVR